MMTTGKKILAGILTLFMFCTISAQNNTSTQAALVENINGAIGPFDNYSDGYGNPGASGLGYVSVFKLEVGMSEHNMDPVLEDIVAFDRAETNGAYFGQVNMLTASSFNGLRGLIWGYDLATSDTIAKNKQKPLFKIKYNNKEIPVYSAQPLLDAGLQLFGTNNNRHFPLIPGAHVITATKSVNALGPVYLWCAAGVAIAKNRTKDADLFIEDTGKLPYTYSKKQVAKFSEKLLHNIALSMANCGHDSNVEFKEIYIGYKIKKIPENYVGEALVAAPYIVLAKNAIPKGKAPAEILGMTLSQWEKELGFKHLKFR